MRKLTIAAMLLLSVACNNNRPQQQKTTGIQYTCPMHPQVISSKPGACPKCGMELVEKDDTK